MSSRAFPWMGVALLLGCAAPEDNNPAQRCASELDCPESQICYRGYCVESELEVELDDAWSDDRDARAPALPEVDDATDEVDVRPDAAADAGGGDAAMVPAKSVPVASDGRAPSAPSTDAGSPPPATSTPPADAGAAPASPPATPPASPPATPPASPPATPPPTMQPAAPPATPPVSEPPASPPPTHAGSWLGGLIEAGIAPVSLLACVPSCLDSEQKHCERCIDRVLRKERGSNPCDHDDDDDDDDDDEESRGQGRQDPVCAVWSCARGSCRSGS